MFNSSNLSSEASLALRIRRALQYKYDMLIVRGDIGPFLKFNSYFLILPLTFYYLKKKNYYKVLITLSAFILAIFVDLTTLDPPIHGSYSAILLMFFLLALYIVLNGNVRIAISSIAMGLILYFYAPSFFCHDYSHDNETKSWTEIEYKNLEKFKKAKVNPYNWEMDL